MTQRTGATRRRVFHSQLNPKRPSAALKKAPEWKPVIEWLAKGLDLDGKPDRLSIAEWKYALDHLAELPVDYRDVITGLRPLFVRARPPTGRLFDAADYVGSLSHLSEAGTAAANFMRDSGTFDLDGYPALISEAEIAAARRAGASLPLDVAQGLPELTRLMRDIPKHTGKRRVETTAQGARIHFYPGTDAELRTMRGVLDSLSRSKTFKNYLAKLNILLTPPGQGLSLFDPTYSFAEGVARTQDIAGVKAPVLVLRSDSLQRWTLGAAHELIHLLEADLGPSVMARVDQVWKSQGYVEQAAGGANAREMLAYFGQYYLAGFGDLVEQKVPAVGALLRDILGDARVDPGTLTEANARAWIERLDSSFRK